MIILDKSEKLIYIKKLPGSFDNGYIRHQISRAGSFEILTRRFLSGCSTVDDIKTGRKSFKDMGQRRVIDKNIFRKYKRI